MRPRTIELMASMCKEGLDAIEFTKLLVEFMEIEQKLVVHTAGYQTNVQYTQQILLRFERLRPLFKKYIEYFDFSLLGGHEQASLVSVDWDIFSPYMKVYALPVSLRVEIVRANPTLYIELLSKAKITAAQLSDLLVTQPELGKVVKNAPFERISILAWESLLAHDMGTYGALLEQRFVKIRNKTKLRKILEMFPGLLKNISIETAKKTVLSPKELVLLAHECAAKLPKSVASWAGGEVTISIVAGKFKATKPLKKAIDYATAP